MRTLSVICLLVLNFTASLACGGYKIKFDPIKSCVDNSIIQAKDFSLTIDNDCQLIPKGCIISSKPIKTAKATYTLRKPPMPNVVGKMDLCKVLVPNSKRKTIQYLVEMGIKCPLAAKKICASGKNKIDFSKMREKLPMLAGRSDLTVEMEHDSGKSCFQIAMDVEK